MARFAYGAFVSREAGQYEQEELISRLVGPNSPESLTAI